MINDLDKTIRKLLSSGIVGLAEQDIHFDAPDENFKPDIPAMNLFLYDVRENRELRNKEWLVERQSNGQMAKEPAPVRIDCSYLITAWAGDPDSEHRWLGDALKALLRHPTIPAGVLQGSLKNQDLPLPTTTLQPGRLQSVAEFWQALGGKPKAALNYMVTIAVQPFEPVITGPPVVKTQIPGRRQQQNE